MSAGRWVETDGETDESDDSIESEGLTDELSGASRDRASGHHFFPQAHYRDLPLSPETRAVFEESRTGRLYVSGHRWDTYHAEYSRATRELFDRYVADNNIRPEQMTPDQARSFVKAIQESRDPRIRNYNMNIRFREMLYRLRTGRGID